MQFSTILWEVTNVFKVNGTAFQDCIVPPANESLVTRNDDIPLLTPGGKWYICGWSLEGRGLLLQCRRLWKVHLYLLILVKKQELPQSTQRIGFWHLGTMHFFGCHSSACYGGHGLTMLGLLPNMGETETFHRMVSYWINWFCSFFKLLNFFSVRLCWIEFNEIVYLLVHRCVLREGLRSLYHIFFSIVYRA